VIKEAGDGVKPTSSSIVTVAYKGYYTDGEVFDESSASGITFPLQNVIKGWTEEFSFKEGGSGTLLIPSHLGYGSNDSNGSYSGSVLVLMLSSSP
jgi:FKBP-type peptidyl-prolyl cis-trans isomerase FkpA